MYTTVVNLTLNFLEFFAYGLIHTQIEFYTEGGFVCKILRYNF